MTPEEECILAAVTTGDLVPELAEIHSRAMVISRTLGEELERNSATVVTKVNAELNDSSNSLKMTLVAMET